MAFSNSDANPAQRGWISLLASKTPASSSLKPGQTISAEIGIDYSERTSSNTSLSYQFVLPTTLLWSNLYVVLVGDARLQDIRPSLQRAMSISNHTCNSNLGAAVTLVPCQVITFTPRIDNLWPDYFDGCISSALEAHKFEVTPDGYFGLKISGKNTTTTRRIDLFHTQYTVPTYNNLISLNSTETAVLDSNIGFPSQVISPDPELSCQRINIDPADEYGAFASEPDSISGNTFDWDWFASAAAVVVKDRNSDRWGNVALIAAGALAGLAVGILPFAWEATSRLRRERKAQKSA